MRGRRSHLNVKIEKCRWAVHACSYGAGGQGKELSLVRRGDMPTAEVIGDGVGATRNVLCAEFKVVKSGQEPDLTEASLHAMNSGAAGV